MTDATSPGEGSEGDKGTSAEPVTFTQAELAEHNRKLVSDDRAEHGRASADLKTREAALKTSTEKLNADIAVSRKDREDREETAARASDNPNDLTSLIAKRAQERAADDLAVRERTHEDNVRQHNEEVAAAGRGDAAAIAKETGVSQAMIEMFSDGSDVSMRAYAASVKAGGKAPDTRPTDSGRSSGGQPTYTELAAEYVKDPTHKANREAYLAARKAEGR